MSQDTVIAAVEIGTSKVAVLLGEITGVSGLNIIGHKVCASTGVRKGEIIDLGKTGQCVHTAIFQAEKEARSRANRVYLAQTGSHLRGDFNLGSSNISSPDGIVSPIDIEAAKKDALRRSLPRGRAYIHHIRNPFFLDGNHVENPISKKGRQLQVGYWSVHGDSEKVNDSLRIIQGIDLEVADVIISGVASGAVLLEETEKENGALVIDMGGGTTDYVLYRKGYIVRTGVVPVGGDHITNDLSLGLRVARKNAENFKIKNGRAFYKPEDKKKTVWLIGDLTIGDREYPMEAITAIIEARVSEVFEIIKNELEESDLFNPADIASGVVLTGGGSRLTGIAELAAGKFDLDVRISGGSQDVAQDLRLPEYSTTLGLLHYALARQESVPRSAKLGGLFQKLIRFLSLR